MTIKKHKTIFLLTALLSLCLVCLVTVHRIETRCETSTVTAREESYPESTGSPQASGPGNPRIVPIISIDPDTGKDTPEIPAIRGASTSPTGKYTNASFSVWSPNLNARMHMKAPDQGYFTGSGKNSAFVSDGSVNGLYTFYATNEYVKTVDHYVYYDTVAPVGIIKTDKEIESGTYTNEAFLYMAIDSGSGVAGLEYKRPGGSGWETYNGTTISPTMGDGWYYFRAVDLAGNTSVESSVYLNTKPPIGKVYCENSVINSNDSFVSGAFIKFTAADILNRGVESFVKGPGQNTFIPYENGMPCLEEGSYMFYSKDKEGNQSEVWRLTLDRTAPVGILFNAESSIDDGTITNSDHVYYAANDTVGIAGLYVKKPGSEMFLSMTEADRFYEEGTYEFYCLDKSGNRSEIVSITLDKTAPDVMLFAGGNSVNDDTKTNSQYVSMMASDSQTGIKNLFVKLPETQEFIEYASSTELTNEGTYFFYAMDLGGNKSKIVQITIDRTAPNGQLYAGENKIENEQYTNASHIKFVASDAISGLAGLFVRMPGDKEYLIYNPDTILNGMGQYMFYAEDIAGNRSNHYSIFVDRFAPINMLYADGKQVSSGQITNVSCISFSAVEETKLFALYVKKPNQSTFVPFKNGTYFTANGSYSFYAEDAAGNCSDVVTIMLDQMAPIGQVYSKGNKLDNSAVTNGEDISFVAWDANSGLRFLYVKLPGKSEFTIYETGVKLYVNGRYEFKATDNAGNDSIVYSVVLDNIIPEGLLRGPDAEIESGLIFNFNHVTFFASDVTSGVAAIYFRVNNGNWTDYTNGKKITAEGRIQFYAEDAAGNRTKEFSVTIDRTKPEGRLSTESGSFTNEDFSYTSTDTFTGVKYNQVKIPGGKWIEYIDNTVIPKASKNGWYYFRCFDNADNMSDEVCVYLDTTVPTGQLYTNDNPIDSGTYTNLERIYFIAFEENLASCFILEPNETNWKLYTSGALYSVSGKYEFYAIDKAGNRSETFKVIIDRMSKPITLNNVKAGYTDGNVTIVWKDDDANFNAPIVSVTINDRNYKNGSHISTIYGGKYVVNCLDAAGNTWSTEFLSVRRNILTDTVNKEWWESATEYGSYYAFASYENALNFAIKREKAQVRTGQWTASEWDAGIMMDAKDSVNAQNGTFFIYKKSGTSNMEVAYFTEARLNEVILEYATIGIRHFYYWNSTPNNAAANEDIFSLNTDKIFLGAHIRVTNDLQFYIDGKPFNGSRYDIAGKHSVVVKDEWGNSAEYTFIVIGATPNLQLSVGEQPYTNADVLQIYYLKNSVKITITDALDDYAMFYIKDQEGQIVKILSMGEEYELKSAGKYTIQAVNHFGLTEELTVYISFDAPTITFIEKSTEKQLEILIAPGSKTFAILQSLTIYRSFDSKNWAVLTADDYDKAINCSSLRYRFRSSGQYKVIVEDPFHSGFDAIEKTYTYAQPAPCGVLKGINNNGFSNTIVTFSWTDEADVVVRKNGQTIEYVSGQEMTDNGSYEIIMKNLDGQKIVYAFIIDTIAPELDIIGVQNGKTTKGDVILSAPSKVSVMKVYLNEQEIEYVVGNKLSAKGQYRVVLTDQCGNTTEYRFEILSGINGGMIALIVVAVLALTGIGLFIALKKRKIF